MRVILRNARELGVRWAYAALAIGGLSLPFMADALSRGKLPMLAAIALGISFYVAVLLAPDDFDA